MGKIYIPTNIKIPGRHMALNHNVTIVVRDADTMKPVHIHEGHNAATNSLLTGIAHYLTGDGILNQGWHLLSSYVPKYISLGTMGLINQESDENGLPLGIGSIQGTEEERFEDYMLSAPGFGADGYDSALNNGREFFGLGPMFADRAQIITSEPELLQLGDINFDGQVDDKDVMLLVDYNCGLVEFTERQKLVADINQDGSIDCEDMQLLRRCASGEITAESLGTVSYSTSITPTINCELISNTFPRAAISYREIVPETEAEYPETIDVVYSAMISVGALSQFRESGKNYLFITEAGLWSRPDWVTGGDNGLLAGYRIAPSDHLNWGMTPESVTDEAIEYYEQYHGTITAEDKKSVVSAYNRNLLKQSIIRVNSNQVVQVIWKIQLGGLQQLIGLDEMYDTSRLYWYNWNDPRNYNV